MIYSSSNRNVSARTSKSQKFADSYAKVGLETEVLSASPEKIIALLLAGARASIAKAKLFIEIGNIPEKAKAITKATDIVTAGLRAAVDESAGEVAQSLTTTYDLIAHHLLLANLRSDVNHLDLADTMLADIQSAWLAATNLPA